MAFMTLALAQVFHAFNARSQRRSAFTPRLFTNGWLWAAVLLCLLLQVAAVSCRSCGACCTPSRPPPPTGPSSPPARWRRSPIVELVKLVQRWRGPGRQAMPSP